MTETKQQPRALVWKGMLGNKIVASLSHYMEACQDFFMEDLHFRGGLCRATWQDLPKSQIYQKYKIIRNPSSGDLSQRYLGQYPKWLTHNWSVVSCLREKVLSEHSHFHLWVVWGSFCVAMVELSSSTETVWTPEFKVLTIWPQCRLTACDMGKFLFIVVLKIKGTWLAAQMVQNLLGS